VSEFEANAVVSYVFKTHARSQLGSLNNKAVGCGFAALLAERLCLSVWRIDVFGCAAEAEPQTFKGERKATGFPQGVERSRRCSSNRRSNVSR
jgi:hypothetical protein